MDDISISKFRLGSDTALSKESPPNFDKFRVLDTKSYDYYKSQNQINAVGIDTLKDDLLKVNESIKSAYNEWQSKEIMKNTHSDIKSMYSRLTTLQNLCKTNGVTDGEKELSEVVEAYKSTLDGWNDLTSYYDKFKTADEYNKSNLQIKKINDEYNKARNDDVNAVKSELNAWEKELEKILSGKEWLSNDEWRQNNDGNFAIPYSATNLPEVFAGKTLSQAKEIVKNKKAYLEKVIKIQENEKYSKLVESGEGEKGYKKWLEYAKNTNEYKYNNATKKQAPKFIGKPIRAVSDNVVLNKMIDTSYARPKDDWTIEELYQFGARWDEKNPDIAYNYATQVNNEKAIKQKNKARQEAADFATKNFATGTLATIGSFFAKIFAISDFIDDFTDKAAYRNAIVEEPNLTPFEWATASTGAISEKLNQKGTLNSNIPIIGGKGWGDIYALGGNIAQSAALTAVGGPWLNAISFFGQGAADAVNDATERGATIDEALCYGTIVGAAEMVSEYIGADKLLKVGKGEILSAFKEILKQAGAEGIEEMFSETINNIADNVIMGDKSRFNQLIKQYKAQGLSEQEAASMAWTKTIEEIAYSGLSGMLSGSVHATSIVIFNKINKTYFDMPLTNGYVDVSVIDFSNAVTNTVKTNNGNQVNWNNLDFDQQTAIIGVSNFAKNMGLNVTWISDGAQRGMDGAFEINGNKMLIDVNAGKTKLNGSSFTNTIIPTTSHEMVHWAKNKSPEIYTKLEDFVFETFALQGISKESVLDKRRTIMEKAHKDVAYTDEEVTEEVVARACEDMLQDSKKFKKYLYTMNTLQQRTLLGKLTETFNKIKKWINNFSAEPHSSSNEAQIISKDMVRFKQQVNLYEKMLINASNNKDLRLEFDERNNFDTTSDVNQARINNIKYSDISVEDLAESKIYENAKDLKQKYNSNIDESVIIDKLKTIANNKNMTKDLQIQSVYDLSEVEVGRLNSAQQMICELAVETAQDIKPVYDDYANEVLSFIKGDNLYLDRNQRLKIKYMYGSLTNYYKRVGIKLSNHKNPSLDEDWVALTKAWQYWSDGYPELFSSKTLAEDMPARLAEVMEYLNSQSIETDYDELSQNIARDLFNRFYSIDYYEHNKDAIKCYTEYFAKLYCEKQIISNKLSSGVVGDDFVALKERLTAKEYSINEYECFGWTLFNDILSQEDAETLFSRYADYKNKKIQFVQTKFGEAIIFFEERPDVLAYIKGSVINPVVTQIIQINSQDNKVLKEIKNWFLVNEEKQNLFILQDAKKAFGDDSITIYKPEDYKSYWDYQRWLTNKKKKPVKIKNKETVNEPQLDEEVDYEELPSNRQACFVKCTDEQAIEKAQEMESDGKRPLDIWRELKIVRGIFGDWVTTIAADGIKLYANGTAKTDGHTKNIRLKRTGGNIEGKLSDFLVWEQLYRKFPHFKDVSVLLTDAKYSYDTVKYLPIRNAIVIDKKLCEEFLDKKNRDLIAYILREVQRMIQIEEGKYIGKNRDYWVDQERAGKLPFSKLLNRYLTADDMMKYFIDNYEAEMVAKMQIVSDLIYRTAHHAYPDFSEIMLISPDVEPDKALTFDKDENLISVKEKDAIDGNNFFKDYKTTEKYTKEPYQKDEALKDNSSINEVPTKNEGDFFTSANNRQNLLDKDNFSKYNDNSLNKGEKYNGENAELLARRTVPTINRGNNILWQPGSNSKTLAECLGMPKGTNEPHIEAIRAGECGWLVKKSNSASKETRKSFNSGILRRIRGIKLSGKDTVGGIVSPQILDEFKDTICKDENGNLISLYHWTTEIFETFKKGEFGFHFGTLNAARDRYLQLKEETPDISAGVFKEVILNITNPIEINDEMGEWNANWVAFHLLQKGIIDEQQYNDLSKLSGFNDNTYDNPAAKAVREILAQNGYDGIIYENLSEDVGSYSLIALYPEQIITVSENGVLKENSGISRATLETQVTSLNSEDKSANIINADEVIEGIRGEDKRSLGDEQDTTKTRAIPELVDLIERLSHGEDINIDEVNALSIVKKLECESDLNTSTHKNNSNERQEIRKEIIENLLRNGSAVIDRHRRVTYNGNVKQEYRADIVIGLPGSGKSSTLAEPLSAFYSSRVIDSDMVKKMLPEYNGGIGAGTVHKESVEINNVVLQKAMANGDNIVYQMIGGGKVNSLINKIKMFKRNGYLVYLHLNELPNGKAIARSLNRYIEKGRFISPDAIKQYGDSPTRNFYTIINAEEHLDARQEHKEYGITNPTDVSGGIWGKNEGSRISEAELGRSVNTDEYRAHTSDRRRFVFRRVSRTGERSKILRSTLLRTKEESDISGQTRNLHSTSDGGIIDGYSHYSNDVERGEIPKLINVSENVREFVEQRDEKVNRLSKVNTQKEATFSDEVASFNSETKKSNEIDFDEFIRGLREENDDSKIYLQNSTNAVTSPLSSYASTKRKMVIDFLKSEDKGLKAFAQRVKGGSDKFEIYTISDVSGREAADIKALLGIDVEGYTHNINTNGIKHILKRHGVNGTNDRTMSNDNDIARMGWVIKNYDNVELLIENGELATSAEFKDMANRPAPQIRYSKKINGTYYVVEAVFENNHNKLWVQSAYLKNNKEGVTQDPAESFKNQPHDYARSSLASPPSNNNISQSEKVVNGEKWQKKSSLPNNNMQAMLDVTNVSQIGENSRKVKNFVAATLKTRAQQQAYRQNNIRAGDSGFVSNKNINLNDPQFLNNHKINISNQDTIGRRLDISIQNKLYTTIAKNSMGQPISLYLINRYGDNLLRYQQLGILTGSVDMAVEKYNAENKQKNHITTGVCEEYYANINNPIILPFEPYELSVQEVGFYLTEIGVLSRGQYFDLVDNYYSAKNAPQYNNLVTRKLREILKSLGYDSIIYKNQNYDIGSLAVVVLDPQQLIPVAKNGMLIGTSGIYDSNYTDNVTNNTNAAHNTKLMRFFVQDSMYAGRKNRKQADISITAGESDWFEKEDYNKIAKRITQMPAVEYDPYVSEGNRAFSNKFIKEFSNTVFKDDNGLPLSFYIWSKKSISAADSVNDMLCFKSFDNAFKDFIASKAKNATSYNGVFYEYKINSVNPLLLELDAFNTLDIADILYNSGKLSTNTYNEIYTNASTDGQSRRAIKKLKTAIELLGYDSIIFADKNGQNTVLVFDEAQVLTIAQNGILLNNDAISLNAFEEQISSEYSEERVVINSTGRAVRDFNGIKNEILSLPDNTQKLKQLTEHIECTNKPVLQNASSINVGHSGALDTKTQNIWSAKRAIDTLILNSQSSALSQYDTAGRAVPQKTLQQFNKTIFKDSNGNLLSLFLWNKYDQNRHLHSAFAYTVGSLSFARDSYLAERQKHPNLKKGTYEEYYVNAKNVYFMMQTPQHITARAIADDMYENGVVSKSEYRVITSREGVDWYNRDNNAAKYLREVLKEKGIDAIAYMNTRYDTGSIGVIVLSEDNLKLVSENGVAIGEKDVENGDDYDFKSVEGFGRMATEDLQNLENRDIFKRKIAKGEVTLEINQEMQNRHVLGTKEYKEGRSYITIKTEELQSIINSNYATGRVTISKSGQIKETIFVDKIIGIDKTLDGTEFETNGLKIHYSKSRTHAVPHRKKDSND